ESALRYAEKHKIGLIAMATESGSFNASVFGAISRDIVRQSRCPVFLMRHQD
ncbi:universal stress protein, partial [Enterococcus faecalis]|uniref:universal stress protein n=1 Tax=Enterococcus faecalis TaxID=1351 RepID=UPI00403F89F9